MMMSNLPDDLVEDILSRVPFIYLRAVRSTCKRWNDLSETRSFVNNHINKAAVSGEREFMMVTEFDVQLVGVNLHTSQNNNVDLSIERKANLTSKATELFRKNPVIFRRHQVIHCNGVFLCAPSTTGHMLVVWNPYWGDQKWILPSPPYGTINKYALGYDKSSGSHKILRLFGISENCLEIYDLSSKPGAWKVPDGTLEWDINYMYDSVSLKGDTYWYLEDKEDSCLLCFDFTSEMFGPRLPLPHNEGRATLSTVKEEKLAVLMELLDDTMDIWVTNNIEPDDVSWSIFLKLDMKPILYHHRYFFVDEEKKVAVVFEKSSSLCFRMIYNKAHIIGENGYFKSLDLCALGPLMYYSYVPSSMKIM